MRSGVEAQAQRQRCPMLLAVSALAAGAVSCASSTAPLPPSAPLVEISFREFRIDPLPGEVAKGRIVLRVTNNGALSHRLLVIPLPEDFPPVLEQVRGQARRHVDPLAAMPSIGKGRSRSLAVDLAPGRYALVCPLTDSRTHEAHARRGMAAEIRVR